MDSIEQEYTKENSHYTLDYTKDRFLDQNTTRITTNRKNTKGMQERREGGGLGFRNEKENWIMVLWLASNHPLISHKVSTYPSLVPQDPIIAQNNTKPTYRSSSIIKMLTGVH